MFAHVWTNFNPFFGSFPAMRHRNDDRQQAPASRRASRGRTSTPPPWADSALPADPPSTALTSDMPITIPLGAATALFKQIATLQKENKYYRTKYEQLLALGPPAKQARAGLSTSGRRRPCSFSRIGPLFCGGRVVFSFLLYRCQYCRATSRHQFHGPRLRIHR